MLRERVLCRLFPFFILKIQNKMIGKILLILITGFAFVFFIGNTAYLIDAMYHSISFSNRLIGIVFLLICLCAFLLNTLYNQIKSLFDYNQPTNPEILDADLF